MTEQIFGEVGVFSSIYYGPAEVYDWSLVQKVELNYFSARV